MIEFKGIRVVFLWAMFQMSLQTFLPMSAGHAEDLTLSKKKKPAPVTLEIARITGASKSKIDPGNRTASVWAGLGGSDCSGLGASTCSSCSEAQLNCATAPFCACNSARIYDSLAFRVELKKSNSLRGSAIAIASPRGGEATILSVITPDNGGRYVDFRWVQLCAVAGATSCDHIDGRWDGTLTIVIDSNANGILDKTEKSVQVKVSILRPPPETWNVFGYPTSEGVEGFILYPEAKKAVVGDAMASAQFPKLSYGGVTQQLNVYLSTKGLLGAVPERAERKAVLRLTDGGRSLLDMDIPDLEPGPAYYFNLGLEDQAGNIVQFYPGSQVPPGCLDGSDGSCPFAVRPR